MAKITKQDADIINSIKKAESLANDAIDIIIKQDLFSIKNKALNDEHYEKLMNTYINDILNDYDNTNNIYKAANEQYLFIKQEYKTNLNEDDRLEFIELNFLNIVNQTSESIEETEQQFEALKQLTNIDTVVFETKILELKIKRFKDLLEKEDSTNPKKTVEIKEKHYLKDLFKEHKKYIEIIKLLQIENFLSEIDENTFDWHGNPKEPSLKSLKLLGSLAYCLKCNKYYNSNTTNKQIAEAFTNSFPNNKLSNTYYGKIEKELSEASSNSKSQDYLVNFHFINSL